MYPTANITPIDYDPSATRVNQENRIKLMLAVARERLTEQAEKDTLEEPRHQKEFVSVSRLHKAGASA